ncbi:MAG: hypothetical protein PHI68_08525 [Candidatus Cloacimonetes bacterium]|nr:hypothetical protein [Candidatus Cloacimonadota bacterium]
MERLYFDNNLRFGLGKLPDQWGFFAFETEAGALAFSYCGNLHRRLGELYLKKDEDRAIEELFSRAKWISYQEHKEPIQALLDYKIALQSPNPAVIHSFQNWENYCYLALDATGMPFIAITEHTNDQRFYIGPFRSRFFLSDVLDSYCRILKLPYCPPGEPPCEKLEQKLCKGYCQMLSESGLPYKELHKLQALLKEAFAHPDNGVLDLVSKERSRYFDDLEFDKADLLDDEIRLLKKYRDWLNFLYICKDLQFTIEGIEVEAGQIKSAKFGKALYHFPVDHTEYRENEALALNKNVVDECRIVYDFYIKKHRG